ncbi:hypothetical protein BASA81_001389 [Batrachochytrium salamandrivorans]|nr:hypothetical protein BASA81_001389 [Batrachochytrium salamandrivorans]
MTKRIKTSSSLSAKYDYSVDNVLGAGAYGTVYKAVDRKTKHVVAIKQMKMDDTDGLPQTALREISVLNELRHPNIVRLLDVDTEPESLSPAKYVSLVFEWMESDLKSYLETRAKSKHTSKAPTPMEQQRMMLQLLSGLEFLHGKSVFHRDLKPANLLFDSRTKTLKIADFGLSRVISYPLRTLTHEIVTLWYRSPEIMLGMRKYSLAVDMWSVGCIFAELQMRGKILWPGENEFDQLLRIFRVLGTPQAMPECVEFVLANYPRWPKPLTSQLPFKDGTPELDLLQRMFDVNEQTRISAKAALKHHYFHPRRSGSRDCPIEISDEDDQDEDEEEEEDDNNDDDENDGDEEEG